MSRAKDHGKRRRDGLVLKAPLLAGLLLLTALTPSQLRAQTNAAKASPPPQRWLLIVETSRPMQRRASAVVEAVQDLLTSGMAGQLRQGDTLGVWTFNADLYAGRLPLQIWSPDTQQDIASRTLTFLKGQKYEKQANLDKVLTPLSRIIQDSRLLTVVLVSSGDDKMRGTAFDAQINEFYQKWRDQQQKARKPFVVVLRAKAGELADCVLNTPPFPTQMPRPSQPMQSAATIQEKLLEALHTPLPPTAPPLILSGKKPQPEQAPAPKPQSTSVKVDAPAAVAVAPGTNNLIVTKLPALTVPPVQMAKAEAAPVTPAKPLTEVVPKPSPAPVAVVEPKVEAVKAPEVKPIAPAPAKLEAAPTVQTLPPKPKPVAIEPPKAAPAPEPNPAQVAAPALAPPVTQQVAVSVSPPRPSPLAPPPSALPTPPAQTATAVPAETLARHSGIWIAGLVLAGVAASLAVLLLRRSRTTPQASLITRSFERKNKP